jgi:hypothetical protein
MGRALRKALDLRDRSGRRQTLREGAQGVAKARLADRAAHAKAVAGRGGDTVALEDEHTARAEAERDEPAKRYEALAQATEDPVEAFTKASETEAQQVAEVAREQREASAAEVRRATEQIAAALDNFEALLGAARWTADPNRRRWRSALRTIETGRPRVRVDRVLAALEELPAALEAQPLPAEESEPATVQFGHRAVGKVYPPPGSARVS